MLEQGSDGIKEFWEGLSGNGHRVDSQSGQEGRVDSRDALEVSVVRAWKG